MRPILGCAILLAALAPAARADVTYEDMARVYQELDEAFVQRKEAISAADYAKVSQWITEGIFAFWGRDYATVVRNFARARQLVRGEDWDTDSERLDAVSLRLPATTIPEGTQSSAARIVQAYLPWTPGPVELAFEVYAGSAPDPGALLRREARALSPEELASGVDLAVPVAGDRTLVNVQISSGPKRQVRRRILYRIADLEERLASIRAGIDTLRTTSPERADDLEAGLLDLGEQVQPSLRTPVFLDLIEMLAELERDLAAAMAGADPLAGRTGTVLRGTRTPAGTHVMYRVVLPPDYDPSRRYPVVLALHGLGIDERTMTHTYGAGALAAEAIRRGYIFVAPRSGEAQTRASLAFRDRSEDDHVLAALDDLAREYSIDPGRVFMFGHSLGAIQSLQTASREPGRFRAVIPVGLTAIVDPRKLRQVPVLMLYGEDDPLGAIVRPFVLAARIAGCDRLETREVPAMGHVLILHFERETVYDFFEDHGGPFLETPGRAWLHAARALAAGDGQRFLSRQTEAVRNRLAGALEVRKARVAAGEALPPDGLDREAFLALEAPEYFAISLESLLADDPELAEDLAHRFDRARVVAERTAGTGRAEVEVRFADGSTAVRRLVLEDGRWRAEWPAGDWLPDALREF